MKKIVKYTTVISIIIVILSGIVFWASTDGLTFINQNSANQNIALGVVVVSAVVGFVSGILTLIDWVTRKAEENKTPKKSFMVIDLPEYYIQRPKEKEIIIRSLLSEGSERSVGITTALEGAGGYGKSELARAVCHDDRIKNKYKDGILWVTLGEQPELTNLVTELVKIYKAVTGGEANFSDKDDAILQVKACLENRKCLLVVDDVWNKADLNPFLQISKDCDRLITTRIKDTLPVETIPVEVDKMFQNEAIQLLRSGKASQIQKEDLEALAVLMGNCPLLLRLANGYLIAQIEVYHLSPAKALSTALQNYNEAGVKAFDDFNPRERYQAYAKTIKPILDLLSEQEHCRLLELAIFPEDIFIPLEIVSKLWWATGGLSRLQCDNLCKRLYNLSILYHYDAGQATIRLHDVTRNFLIKQNSPEQLVRVNGQFLDSFQIRNWADLPEHESYLWDHLITHLISAGREQLLFETIEDLVYLSKKIHYRNLYACYAEMLRVEEIAPQDQVIRLLRQNILRYGHLIKKCQSISELEALLYCRLVMFPEMQQLVERLQPEIPRPWIRPWLPLPEGLRQGPILTITGLEEGVEYCAFSPDGRWIVSGSWQQTTLRVLDAQNGEEHMVLDGYSHCAFSPDGRWIVSPSRNDTLRVWDAQSGEQHLVMKGHEGQVTSCTFSPDGRWIVSGSSYGTVRVWDAQNGKEHLVLNGHEDRISSCAFSPDGHWIVSGSYDKSVRVWDAQNGEQRRVLMGHEGQVTSCTFSPDGRWIASTSVDQTVRLWDAKNGEQYRILRGHEDFVFSCAYSPDGHWIASAGEKTVRIWNAINGEQHRVLIGHEAQVTCCTFSPDGRWIASSSMDKTIRVWDAIDAINGEQDWVPMGHEIGVTSCAVSPDGRWIGSASFDQTIMVWDARSGEQHLVLDGHSHCAFSPDGRWITSFSGNQTVQVWDAQSGEVHLVLGGHLDSVHNLAFSPDGHWIVSSGDNSVRVWELDNGEQILILDGAYLFAISCAFSPDGRRIVTAGDRSVQVWDTRSGELYLFMKGKVDSIRCCAFSPDGQWIVSAGGNTVWVWDAQNGEQHLVMKGHEDSIRSCVFSPDGQWIVSASWDQTIRIWDFQTGLCLAIFHADESSMNSCVFSPDGGHLIAGGSKGLYFLEVVR